MLRANLPAAAPQLVTMAAAILSEPTPASGFSNNMHNSNAEQEQKDFKEKQSAANIDRKDHNREKYADLYLAGRISLEDIERITIRGTTFLGTGGGFTLGEVMEAVERKERLSAMPAGAPTMLFMAALHPNASKASVVNQYADLYLNKKITKYEIALAADYSTSEEPFFHDVFETIIRKTDTIKSGCEF